MATTPLIPRQIRDFHDGIIREVDNPRRPESAVDLAINCHFDRIPVATRRLGTTLLGAQLSGTSGQITPSPDSNVETNTVDGRAGRDLDTASLTFNPSSDGWAGFQGTEGSWATIRGNAGNIHRDQGTSTFEAIAIRNGSTSGVYDLFRRGYFAFDTSSLPDGATITAVTLQLYVISKSESIPNQSLVLCNGGADSNTDIVDGDYDNAGTTAWSNTLALSAVTTGAYNTFTFNATGRSNINTTGYTAFSMRYESDRANSEPAWVSVGSLCNFEWNFGSHASLKPILTVTYEVTVNESFSAIRTGAGTTANDSEASGNVVRLLASSTTGQYSDLRRGILAFDTSAIPDAASITSATLRLFVNSKVETLAGQSLGVVNASSASNTALQASDFSGLSTTRMATDLTLAGLTTAANNTFTLNATGLAAISKTGITKFGLRLSSDIDNTAPTWVSGAAASVNIDFADGTNDPVLTVNYSTGSNLLGLFQYLDDGGGTNNHLVAQVGGVLYELTGTTWTSIDSTRSTTQKERFVNAVGYLFYTNATNGVKTWPGTGAVGTTNATNAPAAKFLEYYKQKVYALATSSYPDRLHWSSTPGASSNLITWDTNNDYVDINRSDGEDASGLKRWSTELLVFKPNQMYRYFGTAGTDPDPITNIGTYSHESIVSTDVGCFFYHPNGVYVYAGGKPQKISRFIDEFVRGVSRSEYDDVAGWSDSDHVYHSVGNIDIDGVTFNNVVFVYTISSQVWTLYSYPTRILRGTPYDNGSTIIPVVGDSNSSVLQFNTGNTDNGSAVFYYLRTGWYELGAFLANETTINQLAAACENPDGGTLSWQKDDDNVNQWYSLGKLLKFLWLSKRNLNIKSHRIRFQFHGASSRVPWIFNGIEVMSGMIQQVNIES